MMTMSNTVFRLIPALLLFASPAWAQQPDPSAAKAVTYKDHVAPILRKHCFNCHNADKASSDLNVTTFQGIMTGGSSGSAISPGNPSQSLLFRLVSHEEEPRMPPKGPRIPDADLAVIKKWIELGAPETAVSAAKS